MCGINGILGLNHNDQAKDRIAAMNIALAHRGPDDGGFFLDENIVLGHRRLSIIDLSADGHQPMQSSDKRYTIVYNGELYNYLEIKNQLTNYPFKTATDTEVILAAYTKWGKDCLQKFNGMFAFAIWDRVEKIVFVARDRLGIKPLYYFYQDKKFIFSSEIRALLASGIIPRKLNRSVLPDYLRYQVVHAPNTIIQHVFMLMPGHYIEASQTDFKIKSYWDIAKVSKQHVEKKSYKDTCKDVNELLCISVERRLIADVPFGAFLSGGIDSSSIVALMSQISKTKVKTFCIVFEEEEFSEAKHSRLVAKKFNTDHHEIKLKPIDFLNQLPEILGAIDHPGGDGFNTYVVSKVTKQAGITMALSGLGGDELFAGYNIFKRIISIQQKPWLNAIPLYVRSGLGNILRGIGNSIATDKMAEFLSLRTLGVSDVYPLLRQALLDYQVQQLLRIDRLPESNVYLQAQEIERIFHNSKLNLSKIAAIEIGSYMQNVLLRDADQMSMASALEVRVPFLDHELVEYILNIPDEYKMPVTSKKLLTDSLNGLVPEEVINRPKMGFTFPWNHWLKNELREFCSQKIASLSQREEFKQDGVVGLWNNFLKNDPRLSWSRVWHLVVLEDWMERNNIEV